jgi:hypothetical protein
MRLDSAIISYVAKYQRNVVAVKLWSKIHQCHVVARDFDFLRIEQTYGFHDSN